MIPEYLLHLILSIVNGENAGALSLSKGGWEGWLQCELWLALVDNRIEAERELKYPLVNKRCDLVIAARPGSPQLWVEIKAFGIFRQDDEDRFIDAIANDVHKLGNYRPLGTHGLCLVVVPNAIAESFDNAIKERQLNGFVRTKYPYVTLFSLLIE